MDMENEPEQEYHVNSGFVNKLRSKFAQLENNSNRIVLSKRSASVENLLSESAKATSEYSSKYRNRHGSGNRSSTDDTNLNSPRTSNVILRKAAPQGYKKQGRINSSESVIQIERPRSNEFLHKGSEKQVLPAEKGYTRSNHVIRGVKPPLPKKNDTKRVNRNSATDNQAPKIEHHDWTIAPDLEKVGRDNIIIIESSAPEKPKDKTRTDHPETDDVFHRAKPVKENQNNEDELPKPHTVSNFRTFFEKANKASDTLRAWQGHSPTRKSADLDKDSPKLSSPVNSPHSPFEKVGDNSVFTITADKETDSSFPQTSITVNKSPRTTSPCNSSEFVPDIDTTPTSIQKSREIFQKNDSEQSEKLFGRSSIDNDKMGIKGVEQNTSHTLTPLHSMTEVFNSKAVKREKSNRPKPVVLARRNSREFTSSNHVSKTGVSYKSIPKDTIELKHEKERKSSSSHEEGADKDHKDLDIDGKSKSSKPQPSEIVTQNDVLNESVVKPSQKKSGKISPRKTKIFDSSNIVKKDRDPPKSPVSTVPPSFSEKPVIIPDTVEAAAAIEDMKEQTKMEVKPVRPARSKKSHSSKLPNSGLTQSNTNIVKNDSKSHSDIRSPKMNKPEPLFPQPKSVDVPVKKVAPSKAPETEGNPVSGRSSFLASRLKKPDGENSHKTLAGHLTNGTPSSPIPRKRQAPARPVENGFIASSGDIEMTDKEQIPPDLPKTPEPKLPQSNIDDIIKRKKNTAQPSTKMVFDSSKIANKRKDAPKRKPPRKTLQELNKNITFDSSPVPKLDLSSITGEKQETEYQEGYIPTVIRPCNIKFIGEGVLLEKNPLKKTKKSKVGLFIYFLVDLSSKSANCLWFTKHLTVRGFHDLGKECL